MLDLFFNHNIGFSTMWLKKLNVVDGAERNSRDKTRKKNLQMTLLCLFHILRATHLNDNSIEETTEKDIACPMNQKVKC